MYESQTKAEILQRMLAATPENLDKRQGSITFDMLSPAAIELAHAYIELDNVLRFGFAGPDQPSEYLDRRAAEFGVTRHPSVKAQGTVIFTGDNELVIPIGTAVATDEEQAIVFVTVEDGVIVGGKAEVRAEAKVGGASGNVGKGRITLVLGNLSGIVTVTNTKAFTNGADTESDESLLGRYLDRARRPATSGNVWHYRQWALEVRGVGDVKVFPVRDGNGTVTLSLLSVDKRALDLDTVGEVERAVKERRPVGARVIVNPAGEVPIHVSAKIKLAAGATVSEVKAAFEKELTAYLAELAFQHPIVPYNRIFGLLLNIKAIADFSELTINGVAKNLEIVDDEVAVSGTVNFIVT